MNGKSRPDHDDGLREKREKIGARHVTVTFHSSVIIISTFHPYSSLVSSIVIILLLLG